MVSDKHFGADEIRPSILYTQIIRTMERLRDNVNGTNVTVWLQDRVENSKAKLFAALLQEKHAWRIGQSSYSRWLKNPIKKKQDFTDYHGLTGFVFETGITINVPDVFAPEIQEIPGQHHLGKRLLHLDVFEGAKDASRPRPYLAVPILTSSSENEVIEKRRTTPIGILTVSTKIGQIPFSETDENLAKAAATDIVRILNVINLINDKFLFLYSRGGSNLEDLMEAARLVLKGDHISIFLSDSENSLYLLYSSNNEFNRNAGSADIQYRPNPPSKTYRVFSDRSAYIYTQNDRQHGPIDSSMRNRSATYCESHETYSWLGVPINRDGKTIGVIRSSRDSSIYDNSDRAVNAFTSIDVYVMTVIAEMALLHIDRLKDDLVNRYRKRLNINH